MPVRLQETSASPFQCQTSSAGRVLTPNILDSYFDSVKAAEFMADGDLTVLREDMTTYIYTLPSVSDGRNCSGTVVSIQYCYYWTGNRNANRQVTIFHLVAANIDESRRRLRIPVQSSPKRDNCTNVTGNYVCCTVTPLHSSQFDVLSDAIRYGVVITGDHPRPLAFTTASNSTTAYRIPSVNEFFAPREEQRTTTGLVLLRFLIGMLWRLKLLCTLSFCWPLYSYIWHNDTRPG